VGFPRLKMAFAALCDRLLHVRRVADVAAQAGDAPVLPSRFGDVFHLGGVTFHTVFFFILEFRLGGRNPGEKQQQYSRGQGYCADDNAGLHCSHQFL